MGWLKFKEPLKNNYRTIKGNMQDLHRTQCIFKSNKNFEFIKSTFLAYFQQLASAACFTNFNDL